MGANTAAISVCVENRIFKNELHIAKFFCAIFSESNL